MNFGRIKGIVRSFDGGGRVAIPSDYKKLANIGNEDLVEIFLLDDSIIMRKYAPQNQCPLCGEINRPSVEICGKQVCLQCISQLNLSLKETREDDVN